MQNYSRIFSMLYAYRNMSYEFCTTWLVDIFQPIRFFEFKIFLFEIFFKNSIHYQDHNCMYKFLYKCSSVLYLSNMIFWILKNRGFFFEEPVSEQGVRCRETLKSGGINQYLKKRYNNYFLVSPLRRSSKKTLSRNHNFFHKLSITASNRS